MGLVAVQIIFVTYQNGGFTCSFHLCVWEALKEPEEENECYERAVYGGEQGL